MRKMRYTITLCAMLFIWGCSDSSDDNDGSASIAIQSLGLTAAGGDSISELPLDGTVEEVTVSWRVKASGPGDTYRILMFAGNADDPFQTEIGSQGCSNSGSTQIYGCNDKGSFTCAVSENHFSCEQRGPAQQSDITAAMTRLTAKACVIDLATGIDENCDEKHFDVTLFPTDSASDDGEGSGQDSDDDGGDQSGNGDGGESDDGDSSGDSGSDGSSPDDNGSGGGTDDTGDTRATGTYPELSESSNLMPPAPPNLDF